MPRRPQLRARGRVGADPLPPWVLRLRYALWLICGRSTADPQSAGEGAESCTPCPINSYAPPDGDGTLCLECSTADHLYSPAVGGSVCVYCYGEFNGAECMPCGYGSYFNTTGCAPCPAGTANTRVFAATNDSACQVFSC